MKMKHRECHCWVWERLSKEWEKDNRLREAGVSFMASPSSAGTRR